MADSKIRVLIVHGFPETTAYISALLGLERDIEFVGSVATGREALAKVGESKPDIVLMGSELPDGDSANVVRRVISKQPTLGVVALVPTDSPEEIRRFMQAGARSFLVFPFSSEQLVTTLRKVYERVQKMPAPVAAPAAPRPNIPAPRGKVITVFGPKGGVGKTMLAVNLAVSLSQKGERQVALLDTSLYFGDLHLFLNIKPDHTVVDFVQLGPDADAETLQQIMQKHSSGISLLARPSRPEHAEMVSAEHLRHAIELMAQTYDLIVVDCPASYDDRMLMVLDRSDMIFLIITPEVGALYNAGIFLDLAQTLGYPRESIHVVLNRHDSQAGISVSDAEAALSHPVHFRVPSRGREMSTTLNLGVPISISNPNSDVSRSIGQMAEFIAKQYDGQR